MQLVSTNTNLEDQEMQDLRDRMPELDVMLGKGAMMPFNNTNSGGRKLLFGTQREHVIPINDGEVAYIQTGFEDQFGEYSSSLIKADADAQIIAKIPKFSLHPDHHYYLILINDRTGMLDVIERVSYKHITESYGYMINNDYLDGLKPMDKINKGDVIQKSVCYDKYDNRKDGLNALSAYISLGQTMEDGIVISKSLQKRIVTPLIHKVSIVANDNDIPLNLFGNTNIHKVIPDIGEDIPAGILAALRRENKEETLYSQTYIRLQDIMMSDDKFTTKGKIVDINVCANNPENLANNLYYQQIKYYYDEDMRFCKNIVEVVDSMHNAYPLSYDLKKLYSICKRKIEGKQYIKDRPFSNVIIEVVCIEQNMIQVGDKISDRYGGKGVVVAIWDDEDMPMLSNGKIVDIIFNKSTCVNRLNAGQLFETSINHIAQRIIEYMRMNVLSTDECIEMYLKFLDDCNPQQSKYIRETLSGLTEEEKTIYMNGIKDDFGINQSLRPISDSCDLDKLDEIYQDFPWAVQYDVYVTMKDSRGRKRKVKARRPIVCGTKYIYRLKQYAEEKFSVTSMSATNIKNENSRSKANKMYRGLYTKTPIRFGEMETGNMGHMGMEFAIIDLMLYSASPHARRMAGEEILTGDPFNIDVKLDTNSTNIGVQQLNTLFKTIGLKIVFEKKARTLTKPLIKRPLIKYNDMPSPPLLIKPMRRIDPNGIWDDTVYDRLREAELGENGLRRPLKKYPLIKGYSNWLKTHDPLM